MPTDTFKATFDGGFQVCKPGSLPSIAGQIRPHLQQGRRIHVRMKRADHLCVTFTGFPPEAVTHNWLGDRVDNPEWTQSILNFMSN